MTEMPQGTWRAIGVVRSALAKPEDAPRQGAQSGIEAVIQLDPQWAPGLEGLEGRGRLWVLAWAHQSPGPQLKVVPRNRPGGEPTGLFNTRSPRRPNPILMTLVELVAVEGDRLTVRGLELVDGTPILDIKPYSAGIDAPPPAG